MTDTLAAVTRIYPSRTDTLDLLTEVLRGSSYDGNTRAPGISDPTPTQADQVGPWLALRDQIRDDLILAAHHIDMLYQKLNRVPSDINTRELAEKHRCQPPAGKEGLEPWVRPECTGIIGEFSEIMLCDACRQRRDYWRAKQARIEGAA